jgi:hypothetical protein
MIIKMAGPAVQQPPKVLVVNELTSEVTVIYLRLKNFVWY